MFRGDDLPLVVVEWYRSHPAWTEAILKQVGYREWIERNYSRRETRV